jgi:3-isopropylmalate/(R)-2-methylmalate dehydratase small subunit
LARENFGCGSSREHAPWALEDYGFRVIIAPSFADIFFNNCFKNGMLPIVLSADDVDALFEETEASEGYKLNIDLSEQSITSPSGKSYKFDVDAFRKHCLLNGLDDIGLTMQHQDAIKAFETKHKAVQPWLFN